MTDTISRAHRSWNMSRIRGKDTAPERTVRSHLHRLGFRFVLHSRNLPGKPDIVLPKYKSVVLVHGCFWHRHQGCKFAYTPSSNLGFWNRKFAGTSQRDKETRAALVRLGWQIVTVWECEVKRNPSRVAARIQNTLRRRSLLNSVRGSD